MPCVQEFGILDRVDPARDYGDSYTPEQYGCVAIDDDYLNDWWPRWAELPSYFHCLARPEKDPPRGRYEKYPDKDCALLMTAADDLFWTFQQAVSYYCLLYTSRCV